MNMGVLLLLAVCSSIAILLIQRTEASKRRLMLYIMLGVAFLAAYWANYRQFIGEFIVALVVALFFNALFWLLIGRYNPVGRSDDNIQVIGMDD